MAKMAVKEPDGKYKLERDQKNRLNKIKMHYNIRVISGFVCQFFQFFTGI